MPEHRIEREGEKPIVFYGDFVDQYTEGNQYSQFYLNLFRSDEGSFILEYKSQCKPGIIEDEFGTTLNVWPDEHIVERFDSPDLLVEWIIEKEGELRLEIKNFFNVVGQKDPDWGGATEVRLK